MKEKPNIVSPVLYLQHHYELLKAEYEYEKEQFRQQTEVMGIGRKVKRYLWDEVTIMLSISSWWRYSVPRTRR